MSSQNLSKIALKNSSYFSTKTIKNTSSFFTKMKNPLVSIVMPVYNGERFLEETINSILNQTFKNFELIIINDGSQDNTLKIIKKHRDDRIVLINNKKNLGSTDSINIGLKIAKGKYIASCNSDDVSHSKRIEVEFNYLEKHPDIFLVGTSAVFIDEAGNEIRRFRKYDDYELLAWRLRKSCSIIYPSIMFRNQGFILDKDFGGATDYNFYYTLLLNGKRLTNLPYFLVKYRVHPRNMTVYNNKKQEEMAKKVIENFKKLPDIGNLRKAYYLSKILFHYLKTIREKKIITF